MPDAPQAVVVVDRTGRIVTTNIEAVLEWRRTHQPEVYRNAINDLARVFAEAAVECFIAEQVEQQRIAGGFAYFARYRLERRLTP